jgi:predicted P-loop ATPase
MSLGGGDIEELLRRLGREALEHEAESHGLSPRAGRIRCPWQGCEAKGPERERDAIILAGKHGHYRAYCHACGTSGDLVDLLQRTRGLSKEEALAHVRGHPVPERARPELRVVGSTPPDDVDKLPASEVKRIWDGLATDSELGRQYLTGRGLDDAIELGAVRFLSSDSTNKEVAKKATSGYRVAALLSDVVGNPRGIQLRLVRQPRNEREPKIVSIKGSVTGRAFFGAPGLVEASPIIGVAEGMADSLALQLWAGDGVVVVGSGGKGALHHVAGELEAAGIDITGKLFVLFPQNDRPQNKSRREFQRLSQLLIARGARVCWVSTPDEYADLADWRQARPDGEWPPPELVKAFGSEPGDDSPPTSVLPDGLAVAVPAQVRTERYSNDFTTLCALLDDGAHREAVMGRGELTFCEMTTRVKWGGRALTETDLSTIRLGLEQVARSTDGKPLKFTEGDIAKALTLLARRRTTHEVREWLSSLKWDGHQRLELELPATLGHESGGFEARLLRRWFVSAVARAFEPGCKVDTVLILTGKQGGKKSTFFEALGGPWFTDSKVEPGDKDGLLIMREAWVVEWAELDAMKRSRSVETTKAFLSARVDMFRRPYGRDVVKSPRHCVFVGTTNETEIFGDATGNRRFWPVEVKVPRIDVRWLRLHREQLFAEAVAAFQGAKGCPLCTSEGERCSAHRWWLTDEEETQLEQRNESFRTAPDPWNDVIADWLDDQRLATTVTTAQVLRVALDQEVDDFNPADGRRVAGVMRDLGWKSERVYEAGAWRRVWKRPEVTP